MHEFRVIWAFRRKRSTRMVGWIWALPALHFLSFSQTQGARGHHQVILQREDIAQVPGLKELCSPDSPPGAPRLPSVPHTSSLHCTQLSSRWKRKETVLLLSCACAIGKGTRAQRCWVLTPPESQTNKEGCLQGRFLKPWGWNMPPSEAAPHSCLFWYQ